MAALVAATVNGNSSGGGGGGGGGSGSGCVAVITAAVAADAESNDANGASANGREARNLAEKQRRDKLNASIQELATMVPHAAESTRRLDKTAVLRFATHGLRLQYVFGKSATRRRRKLNLKVANGSVNQGGGVAGGGGGGGGGGAEYTGNSLINGDTPQLTDKLMQLLDSFFLTLTCNGQIVLVSGSVEQLLGHCQSDLYGQNLLQITHPDDQAQLRQQLIPRDIETLFYQQQQQHQQHHHQQQQQQQQRRHKQSHSQSHSTSASDDDEELEQLEEQQHDQELQLHDEHDDDDDEEDRRTRTPSPETIAHLAAIDERLRADRRCFTVRLARASTRAEATRHYEMVKIDGCFRRSDSSVTGGAAANYPIVSQLIRRSRNNNMLAAAAAAAAASAAASSTSTSSTLPPPCLPQHDAIAQAALHGISGNDIVLVAMARVIRESSTNLSLLCRQPEPYQLEYQTRHLIDGSIIDCDQRIGIVAGYMKDEVRNLSPFSFMHLDDVRWVIVALRQMYDCNNDYGESCYRLLSRNGHFIYLQSKGFLEIDKSSNKVHSFLCVNTLLDEQSGKRKVQEMKNKFSTIIKADIPTDTSPDLPASRAPQQLERIVLYLIENLQKSADGTEHGHEAPASNGDSNMMDVMDDVGCCSSPGSSNATLTLEEQASSPSPQLALVPPAPNHVKHSISKSVDVVNVTSARNLQYQQQQQLQKQLQQQKQQQQQQQQQLLLQQQLQQQQQHSPGSGVIRQLSCCLSESSTLSPGSTSSLELPDEANNSDASPPPPSISATAAAMATPRVSVLQRLMTTPTKPTATAAAATPPATPPTQLHAALTSTLRSLDTQLVTIGEEAQTLYQQQQRKALLPKFERQMDAIMLEHQMQKQLLVNIKSEYDATTATATVTAAPVSVITKQTTTSSESSNGSSSN